jgi:uncharacterized protein (DUF2236 family)
VLDLIPSTIRLPWGLQVKLEAISSSFLRPMNAPAVDFARPAGEPALVHANSVSWRVFKNPVALFVGGIAAVILELAEPAVRTGVWEHSTFRTDPLNRLRRTGLAAMITVYGARSVAEPMIARVVRAHTQIAGTTPAGERYRASDARLLTWVHATAAYGFVQAYDRYVEPLNPEEMDEFYREGLAAAGLYGAVDPPVSQRAVLALFDAMHCRLEPSPVIMHFLDIMRETRTLPGPLYWMQPMLMRAAVDLLPQVLRKRLGITSEYGLRAGEGWMVKMAGAVANRLLVRESPAAQSCLRLGLPINHLYSPI